MKNPVLTKEIFYDQINSYITNKDSLAMINKAYDYAYEKHSKQLRKSGEPYFVHLLAVA